MKVKLSNDEVRRLVGAPSVEFPKYTSQLINLANQNAQGTRPKVVGQMSELVKQSGKRQLREWEAWYRQRHPDAIEAATSKVFEMLSKLKEALNAVDRDLVEQWVQDLVIVKTFIGLRFQEAILSKVAEVLDSSYRLASPEEEAKGIDGYVAEEAVSIKPATYKAKAALREQLRGAVIFYEKKKDGIVIECERF